MRLDDRNAVTRIRNYYRKIYGHENSPSEISSWLDNLLVELDGEHDNVDRDIDNPSDLIV